MKEIENRKDTLHLNKFKDIVYALDDEECKIACSIMARKCPDIMMVELQNYIFGLQNTMSAIHGLMRGLEE